MVAHFVAALGTVRSAVLMFGVLMFGFLQLVVGVAQTVVGIVGMTAKQASGFASLVAVFGIADIAGVADIAEGLAFAAGSVPYPGG